ncbi:hypothetical protein [Ulvibacterium marinum]|uniref:hypothetical protein n=1 Tax=Ulvibacterium marinum TaxID=2419782 RepID=UPI001FEA66A8|nr:hypothetical protein [Ulvibacterium marinum]
MKASWASFFIFLYVLAMLRPVFPLFEYIVDQDYIAEFLCINKEKVEMQCNGKCYLMQRLNEQNEEKKQNLPKIAMEEYPIGFIDVLAIPAQKTGITGSTSVLHYSNNYSFLFSDSSFRPPSLRV